MRSVGIDLGTTNSVCAFINDDGHAEVIPSSDGGRITPSVFSLTEEFELIGKPAIDEEMSNPTRTIRSIKRKMGTNERISLLGKLYSPEEISSKILNKIKIDAESYLNEEISGAVITVPAYFNNDQRQATKTAGELAGLKVLRIINEPTAASLAYGLNQKKNEKILVFDLGGGTFDVTILQISDDGIFEVKSTCGNTHLGGDDFDNIIADMIYQKIAQQENVGKDQDLFAAKWIHMDEDAKVRIREAAEQAKIRLSSTSETTIKLKYLGKVDADNSSFPIEVELKISREQFEQSIQEWLVKIKSCIDQSLTDAKIKPENIDEIILVGGSTRVPIVTQKIEEWLNKKPKKSVNPDEAVAIGAAIQAAMLTGEREKDILLLDVIPLTLGIETLGGVMTTMISRNTTIPTEYKDIFSTAEDNQEKVTIKIYQGERPQVQNNKFLGDFELTEIIPAPRGVPQIEVTFDVDANGILSVHAVDNITQKEQKITITGSSSLNTDEIQEILNSAASHAEEDRKFKELAEIKNDLIQCGIQIKSILQESSMDLPKNTIDRLQNLYERIEKKIKTDDLETMKTLKERSQEVISIASEIIYKKADDLIEGN